MSSGILPGIFICYSNVNLKQPVKWVLSTFYQGRNEDSFLILDGLVTRLKSSEGGGGNVRTKF